MTNKKIFIYFLCPVFILSACSTISSLPVAEEDISDTKIEIAEKIEGVEEPGELESVATLEVDDNWEDKLDITFEIPSDWKVTRADFEGRKGYFIISIIKPRKEPLAEGKHYLSEDERNFQTAIYIQGVNDEYEYKEGDYYSDNWFHKTWKEIIDEYCNEQSCEKLSKNVKSVYFASHGGDYHVAIDGYTAISNKYPLIYFSASPVDELDLLKDLSERMEISYLEAYEYLDSHEDELRTFIRTLDIDPEISEYLNKVDSILESVRLK